MSYRNQQVAHLLRSKQLTNPSGQVVPASGEEFLLFPGGVTSISFTTSKIGQAVVVLFSTTRLNSDANGSGRYEVWLDGSPLSSDIAIAVTNDVEFATLTGFQRFVVPLATTHTLQIRVFAFTGSETLTTTTLVLLGAD